MRPASRDLLFGLVVTAIAAIYHWQANHLPYSGLTDAVGAGGLPKILGMILGGLGIILVLRSARQLIADTRSPPAEWPQTEPFFEKRGFALAGIAAAYILIAPMIGYLPAIFLLLASTAILAGAKVSLRTVATAAMIAIGLAAIFVVLVGTEQPEGPFGPLLRSWGI